MAYQQQQYAKIGEPGLMDNPYQSAGGAGRTPMRAMSKGMPVQGSGPIRNTGGRGGRPGFAGSIPATAIDEGNPYMDQVGDWYQGGLTDKGTLGADLTYSPELIQESELNFADPYNFDPMRQDAMNALDAEQSRNYQTSLTNMAAAGGLTAADRMAMASAMNRGGMGSRGDLLSKLGIAESENIWETDQANDELRNKAYLQNLEMQNIAQGRNIDTLRSERDKQYQIGRDLYRDDLRSEMLDKQVAGAEATAQAMEREASRGGGLFSDLFSSIGL